MLVLHQRRFGILIFCGSILFLFILQATLTFSEYVIQGQQSLRHDADLARKLYRREDNGGHTSNSGHGSEVATASVTHSQRGNKLHTINHNVHGDSDVPDGKGNGNSNPIAAAQGSPVENAHAHKPWLLFHSKHDNDQSMAHASNAEMNSSEEAEMAEDESLELDEGGMWFTMTALITGAFNFSSCIYIMIKTWPRASTDKSAKKRSNMNDNSVDIEVDDNLEEEEKKACHPTASEASTDMLNHKGISNDVAPPSVTLPAPVRSKNKQDMRAILPSSAPDLSDSYYANTSATETAFSDGALSRHRPPLTRKMKRTSTFDKARDAAVKIKNVASRGPLRWSAAAWDLEAYAESIYSNSRTSLVTIDSENTEEESSFALRQPNNTHAELSNTSLTNTTMTDAGHLSQHNKSNDGQTIKGESVYQQPQPQRHHHHPHSHSKHKHVASRHRFALYTTTTDMALTALVTGGALYAAIRGQLPDDGWCRALGLASYALIAMDLALVAFESILFWSAVSQLALPLAHYHTGHKSSNPRMTEQAAAHHSLQELENGSSRSLGRYHWKLWLACTVAPWVLSLSLLPAHGFGWDRYWCFVYNYSAGGKGALAFMVFLHYTVLLIVSLCYIPVLRAARQLPPPTSPQALHHSDKSATPCKNVASNQQHSHHPYETHVSSANHSPITPGHTDADALQRRRLEHHRHVVEGAGITLTHLLLQVVHYTPGTLHVAAQFFDYEDLWIYLVAIIFTQSGALMHALVIGWSEWRESRKRQ